MAEYIERELGWDDSIEKESDYVLLSEGEYDFTVKSLTRGRHTGSEKLPPCHKAILKLEVTNGTDTATIEHNLFLHTKVEGLLSQFFVSIGLKKHGEPLKMNWNDVPGTKGRCKVYIDVWKGKNGQDMQSNKIKSFLDPKTEAVQPSKTFTPGAF